MNKNREQGTGNREQLTEEERHEAATEEAATVGCPSLGLPKLPGGFDGVEESATRMSPPQAAAQARGGDIPVDSVSEEKKKKLKVCNDRSRARLTEVLSIAEMVLIKTVHSDGYKPGQYGQDYRDLGKAICEIRKIIRDSVTDVDPDYEMLALQFARNSFDFSKFQEAMAAVSSMKETDFPGFYYTPGWLCDLAKKLEKSKSGVEVEQRKPTMDFGRFRVVRFAIPGMTLLSFRRKQETLAESGSLVKGRIIFAEIRKRDVGREKLVNCFTVKSYEPGEAGRVLYAGDSWVSMSKTEKMVYRMVKTDIRETQRRHISRKRKAAAAKQQAHDSKAAAGEVK